MTTGISIPFRVRDAIAMPRTAPPEDLDLLFDYGYVGFDEEDMLEWNASKDLAMLLLDAESESVSDEFLFAVYVGTRGEWEEWFENWGWGSDPTYYLDDKFVCLCDADGRVIYPRKRAGGASKNRPKTTSKAKKPIMRTRTPATKKKTATSKTPARRKAAGARR